MREFIVLDTFGEPIKITWNPDAVTLRFESTRFGSEAPTTFDGKEALKLVSFIVSL